MADRSWAEWMFGRGKKPTAPRISSREMAGGHRGVAMGSRAEPDLSAENIAKWEQFTGDEVEKFVYSGKTMYVNSSNVAAAKYDHEKQMLIVGYRGGKVYEYDNVTPQEAVRFAQAQSKGDFVWSVLRVRGSKTAHRKPFRQVR